MNRAAWLREKRAMRPLRRGAVATLDYVLLIGVILPVAAFTMWAGPRIIRLAYEMVYVLLVWPFM
jgi:preprotein translocase subunit Sec63